MNEKYREELVAWAVRTAIVILLAILAALVQRWIGVPITVEPPPIIIVEKIAPTPGAAPTPAYRIIHPQKE